MKNDVKQKMIIEVRCDDEPKSLHSHRSEIFRALVRIKNKIQNYFRGFAVSMIRRCDCTNHASIIPIGLRLPLQICGAMSVRSIYNSVAQSQQE